MIALGIMFSPMLVHASQYYEISESPFSLDIAGKPGDLITVNVWDVAKTEDTADVSRDKKVDQLWNLIDFMFPKVPFTYNLNNSANSSGGGGGGSGVQGQGPGVYWSGKSKHDASLNDSASHKVMMTLQARIIEEVAKNQFLIRGHHTIIVHGKPKKLFVSGIIRKKDIREDNSIMSDHMADAVIEIDGSEVSDLQPGWLYKVIDTIFF